MTLPVSGVTALGTTYTPASSASGTTGSDSSTSGSTNATTKGLLDPQAFLQLLVAQLKYQDPTNPTDTSTFMNQTAMLSQVQTMDSMSSTLSGLAQSQQLQSATSMIGKQVTYIGTDGTRLTGVVTSASVAGGAAATLKIGDKLIPLSGVVEVGQAPTS